jgi:hypothetical protein
MARRVSRPSSSRRMSGWAGREALGAKAWASDLSAASNDVFSVRLLTDVRSVRPRLATRASGASQRRSLRPIESTVALLPADHVQHRVVPSRTQRPRRDRHRPGLVDWTQVGATTGALPAASAGCAVEVFYEARRSYNNTVQAEDHDDSRPDPDAQRLPCRSA